MIHCREEDSSCVPWLLLRKVSKSSSGPELRGLTKEPKCRLHQQLLGGPNRLHESSSFLRSSEAITGAQRSDLPLCRLHPTQQQPALVANSFYRGQEKPRLPTPELQIGSYG